MDFSRIKELSDAFDELLAIRKEIEALSYTELHLKGSWYARRDSPLALTICIITTLNLVFLLRAPKIICVIGTGSHLCAVRLE